jgi:DNA-binding PadR family transcriptional regulator
MVTRLTLLSLLSLGPSHGYGLREVIESWRMDRWANVSFGSIYQVLERMARQGFVSADAPVQDSRRPARTTYRITPAGRDELRRLLRQAWSTPAPYVEAIDVALSFAPLAFLDRTDVVSLLQTRLDRLEDASKQVALDEADTLERSDDAAFQTAVRDHFDHFHQLLRTERNWTRKVLRHAEAGRYEIGASETDG